jgi:hypothetical protein
MECFPCNCFYSTHNFVDDNQLIYFSPSFNWNIFMVLALCIFIAITKPKVKLLSSKWLRFCVERSYWHNYSWSGVEMYQIWRDMSNPGCVAIYGEWQPTTCAINWYALSTNKRTPWPLIRERTIPTERPPLVDEMSTLYHMRKIRALCFE